MFLLAPLRPLSLQVSVLNESAIALYWEQPTNGRFDSFIIETISVFENKFTRFELRSTSNSFIGFYWESYLIVYRVEPNEMIGDSANFFKVTYEFVLDGLRPGTSYHIRIQSSSYDVISSAVTGFFNTCEWLF